MVPSVTLNTQAMTLLGNLVGSQGGTFEGSASVYAALVNAATISPYMAGLLNAFSSQPGAQIVFGAPNGGTFASGSTLTIDPSWAPLLAGGGGGEPPFTFATTVAHELGHATIAGGEGYVNSSGVSINPQDPNQAVTSGEVNEGVALTAEYIVARQLNLASGVSFLMHSDQEERGQS